MKKQESKGADELSTPPVEEAKTEKYDKIKKIVDSDSQEVVKKAPPKKCKPKVTAK